MNKYKTFEELKEELGDKFEDYMYKANIELLKKLDKIKELVKNNIELYRHDMDLTDYRTTMNTSGFIKALLELLEEVDKGGENNEQ